jgi:DNA-binding helix-hairpin-helix protein with protein kinase domain
VAAVERSTLGGALEQLGAGGEGTVYRVATQSGLAYKEYKSATLAHIDLPTFTRRVAFPSQLQGDDQSLIAAHTVWPQRLVNENGQLRGFTMQLIPDRFFRRYGLAANPKRVPCEWNYLAYRSEPRPPHFLSEIPDPSTTEVIRLLQQLARLVELFHRHGFIVGDISGKNLLWSVNPVEVLIIDCDSIRLQAETGTGGQKESPGWADPALAGRPTSHDSDVFKLGVAAYRALWRDPIGAVQPSAIRSARTPDIPPGLIDLVERSVRPTGRPSAAQWVQTLDNLNRFGGRPVIAVEPVQGDSTGGRTRPRLNVQAP